MTNGEIPATRMESMVEQPAPMFSATGHAAAALPGSGRRASRDWVLRALAIAILLAVLPPAIEAATRLATSPLRGGLEQQSFANIGGAHVTFTNVTGRVRYECVVAVLEGSGRSMRVESQRICSGHVPPHSTVTIDAPFKGEIKNACSDARGNFSWDDCTFTLEKAELD